MENTLAKIVSFVFHPLLITTYLFSLFAWVFPEGLSPLPAGYHPQFVMLLVLVTFALPVLFLGILRTMGIITSIQMTEKKERIIPFMLISLMYSSITCLFYTQSGIHPTEKLMKIMIIIDVLVIVATLITFFYKVSVHSLAAWGVIGILIPLMKITQINALFYPTLVVVILTGVIMWARLVLQVHSFKEVMWGGVAGLATSIAGMTILY